MICSPGTSKIFYLSGPLIFDCFTPPQILVVPGGIQQKILGVQVRRNTWTTRGCQRVIYTTKIPKYGGVVPPPDTSIIGVHGGGYIAILPPGGLKFLGEFVNPPPLAGKLPAHLWPP